MALLKVETVDNAIVNCRNHLTKYRLGKTEIISLEHAIDRISSTTILSHEHVPNFTRSTVDGYALRSKETQGASDSIPTLLKCIGHIKMGETTNLTINPGECAYVPTGGMLPEGADAVVMIEYIELFNTSEILVYRSVSENENVLRKGEDVQVGSVVIEQGKAFNLQTIGLCASVGISQVEVYTRLNAVIISTGDEVYPVNHLITVGQVHDINGSLIKASLNELNINVVNTYLIKDDFEELKSKITSLVNEVDLIFVSGGSSQGEKDYTIKIFESLGSDVVWSHGLAIKPGKPSILGAYGSCLLIGLPGHPVSAFTVFNRVFKTAYKQTYNQTQQIIQAKLDTNVISSQGKETIIYVYVYQKSNEMFARVIYTKSGLISTLLEANAYIIVPGNLEGFQKGEIVPVILI
jgi:molybdopterin molybdotransferase